MENQNNQESTNVNDQADGKFDRSIKKQVEGSTDKDSGNDDGRVFKNKQMNQADEDVRENEDASLQDKSYSFGEDNTDDEEYHDIDDVEDEETDLIDKFDTDDNNIY